MTIDRRYFVDVFGDIVNEVRKIYDPSGLEKPYYLYGHPIDITKQLELLGGSTERFKKYPLVCLLLDNPQKRGDSLNVEYSVSPTVLVLARTLPAYISEQRTIETFKPILYPIALELLNQIDNSRHLLSQPDGIKCTWTDKYFWGKQGIKMKGYEGLIFNDYLDGIQLDFSEIKVLIHSQCNY